jgi:hypothetical protein
MVHSRCDLEYPDLPYPSPNRTRTPIIHRRMPPLATTMRQARWLQQEQHAVPPGVPLTIA